MSSSLSVLTVNPKTKLCGLWSDELKRFIKTGDEQQMDDLKEDLQRLEQSTADKAHLTHLRWKYMDMLATAMPREEAEVLLRENLPFLFSGEIR